MTSRTAKTYPEAPDIEVESLLSSGRARDHQPSPPMPIPSPDEGSGAAAGRGTAADKDSKNWVSIAKQISLYLIVFVSGMVVMMKGSSAPSYHSQCVTETAETQQQDPNDFTETHAACFLDPHCHTMYLHITKTGGTTIEQRLEKVHENGNRNPSCCGEKLMQKFRANKEEYCMSSFRSFQISPSQLVEVVDTCTDVYHGTANYLQVLISIREPISREVSRIHQLCNVNVESGSKSKLDACGNCSFEKDKEFWLGGTEKSNGGYVDVLTLMSSQSAASSPASSNQNTPTLFISRSIPILIIDVVDLNSFFAKLPKHLPSKYAGQFERTKLKNTEQLGVCDFHMPSAMMKSLYPASKAYRNISSAEMAGLDWVIPFAV